jgi:hypothetical protein
MSNHIGFSILLAGIGIGVAATLLIKDRQLRTQVTDALSNPDVAWKKGQKVVSDVKGKVKDKIDDAADATRKAVDTAVDRSKDAAHKAGEHLERGGKRLQDA